MRHRLQFPPKVNASSTASLNHTHDVPIAFHPKVPLKRSRSCSYRNVNSLPHSSTEAGRERVAGGRGMLIITAGLEGKVGVVALSAEGENSM